VHASTQGRLACIFAALTHTRLIPRATNGRHQAWDAIEGEENRKRHERVEMRSVLCLEAST